MRWTERHRLWHVLGTVAVIIGVVLAIAFCDGSKPLGVQEAPAAPHDELERAVPDPLPEEDVAQR